MKIPGLPEGVELVRFGIATADEFEVLNDTTTTDAPLLSRGPRAGSSAQVIVRPSDGWKFVPQRSFNIRTYKFVDSPLFIPVKVLTEPLEISVTVRFKLENEQDMAIVQTALAQLINLPGYVETT